MKVSSHLNLSESDPFVLRQWSLSFSVKMVESRSISTIFFLPSYGTTLTHNRDLLNVFGVNKLNKQKSKFLEKLFHWRVQIELYLHLVGNSKILLILCFWSCLALSFSASSSSSGPGSVLLCCLLSPFCWMNQQ